MELVVILKGRYFIKMSHTHKKNVIFLYFVDSDIILDTSFDTVVGDYVNTFRFQFRSISSCLTAWIQINIEVKLKRLFFDYL